MIESLPRRRIDARTCHDQIMEPKAELADLVETWWSTARVMEAMPGKCSAERSSWHAHTFEKILTQCGWTTTEWNEAIDQEHERRRRENEGKKS